MFIDLDSRESKFESERAKRAALAKSKQQTEERKKQEHHARQLQLEGQLDEMLL